MADAVVLRWCSVDACTVSARRKCTSSVSDRKKVTPRYVSSSRSGCRPWWTPTPRRRWCVLLSISLSNPPVFAWHHTNNGDMCIVYVYMCDCVYVLELIKFMPDKISGHPIYFIGHAQYIIRHAGCLTSIPISYWDSPISYRDSYLSG